MERIGKYVVHKAVLTSGYARIFLCHDPDLQVPVAIKLFDPKPGDDSMLSPAQQLTRFLTEARTLASFDHPYIIGVKVMEMLGDGRPFFVMPYMAAHLPFEIGKDDPDAPEERDRPRRMPAPRAMVALKQISSATLALHRRNLVHRFIKPSNILLTAPQNGTLKLCDFSMIKLPERNLPMPDHWMGGIEYTAPEQRDNATAVTPRADVFSLGVMAYRLLTGTLPDLAAGAAELTGEAPPALVDLVRACTDPNPEKRPAHAGEVLIGLEKVPPPRPVAPKPVVRIIQPRRRIPAVPVTATPDPVES